MSDLNCHVVVVGGGPAGLAAACLLAADGAATTLIAADGEPDPRTVALMQPGLRLLQFLKLWPGELEPHAAPLRKLRLVDSTGALFSAPAITFDADELELEAFGWNVPLQRLIAGLRDRALELGVRVIQGKAVGAHASADAIVVDVDNGERVEARLCVAADGATSPIRHAAGIGVDDWGYDQSALTTSFAHSMPHDGISTEHHRQAGPFTTVPLPNGRSSLVWMDRPARIEELQGLSNDRLAAEIQAETHGELGRISDVGPRKTIAMRGLLARRFAGKRVMLIGEAAHVVPPIGAQGLNMSLRDAALLADIVLSERSDPGAAQVLEKFNAARRHEVAARQRIVDAMNRSLLFPLLPVDALRAAGMLALGQSAFLRREVMKIGLADDDSVPFAMRA
jgi:2-octaprenyl-6-methoxyphenol hydroxylase